MPCACAWASTSPAPVRSSARNPNVVMGSPQSRTVRVAVQNHPADQGRRPPRLLVATPQRPPRPAAGFVPRRRGHRGEPRCRHRRASSHRWSPPPGRSAQGYARSDPTTVRESAGWCCPKVPADTGETALEAAHLTVLDTAAGRSQDSDRTRTADRGSGKGGGSGSSGSESTSDPTSPGPDPNGRGDVSKGK